jgi:hypothetical protein
MDRLTNKIVVFIGGKPVNEAQNATCFPCHQANAKGHDFLFTRYAP